MENRRNTFDVNEEVSKCESLAELQEILSRNSNYYYVWKNYINYMVEKNHLNYVQLAKTCHCSRNTVNGAVRVRCHRTGRLLLKLVLGFVLHWMSLMTF